MLLAQIDPSLLFLAGCVLIVMVLVRRSRTPVPVHGGGAFGTPVAISASDQWPASQSGAAARWEVEMRQLADELSAALTTRIAIVEQLLREADDKAQQLRLLAQSPHRGDRSLADGCEAGSELGEDEGWGDNAEPAPRPASAQLPYDRQVAIYALSDAGYRTAAIADRLEVPVADVELMLSLRSDRV